MRAAGMTRPQPVISINPATVLLAAALSLGASGCGMMNQQLVDQLAKAAAVGGGRAVAAQLPVSERKSGSMAARSR